MNNEMVEVIDSSQMTVLADFHYLGEVVNNIEHYYLGVLDNKFMVRTRGLTGNTRGDFFIDRSNYAAVVEKTSDVYDGKLKDVPDVDYFSFNGGKDFLVIGITSIFPMAAFKPIVKFKLMNKRRAKLDGLDLGGWDLYMSLETGKKMLVEMKRIENQVASQSE